MDGWSVRDARIRITLHASWGRAGTLLHRVSQLVRQQSPSCESIRRIGAVSEKDVSALRKGAGAQGARCPGRRGIIVQADSARSYQKMLSSDARTCGSKDSSDGLSRATRVDSSFAELGAAASAIHRPSVPKQRHLVPNRPFWPSSYCVCRLPGAESQRTAEPPGANGALRDQEIR